MRSCAICTTWYIREYEEDAADMNVNLYQIVKNSRKWSYNETARAGIKVGLAEARSADSEKQGQ